MPDLNNARGLQFLAGTNLKREEKNLLLAAESMNLAACPAAAFFDGEMNALLGLDGREESVLYLAAVGGKVTE